VAGSSRSARCHRRDHRPGRGSSRPSRTSGRSHRCGTRRYGMPSGPERRTPRLAPAGLRIPDPSGPFCGRTRQAPRLSPRGPAGAAAGRRRGRFRAEHGPVLAAVPGQIALPITVEVQPPRHHRAPAARFHTAVRIVRPCQGTSCGMPTFTDSKLPARRSAATELSLTQRAPRTIVRSRGAAALVLASAVVAATGYPSPRTRSHPAALEVSLRDLACLVFVAGSPAHLNGRARGDLLSPGARGRDEPAPWFLVCLG
jgi:hypothetical protein